MNFVQSNCSQDYWANPVKAFRSVCVTGPTKKKKLTNDRHSWEWRWEGKKKRLTPFPSSHRPPRAIFFFAIFIGVPSGSPCEGLRASPRFHVYNTYFYDCYETKATTAWSVGEAVFTPILGSLWFFLPIFLQSWGILGASIPEWGIENNACRFNLPVSQKFAQGFRAALLDALSQLARSLAICREAGSR